MCRLSGRRVTGSAECAWRPAVVRLTALAASACLAARSGSAHADLLDIRLPCCRSEHACGRVLRTASRISSLRDVLSAAAFVLTTASRPACSRTGTTTAGAVPIRGRPGRLASCSVGYPRSASSARARCQCQSRPVRSSCGRCEAGPADRLAATIRRRTLRAGSGAMEASARDTRG